MDTQTLSDFHNKKVKYHSYIKDEAELGEIYCHHKILSFIQKNQHKLSLLEKCFKNDGLDLNGLDVIFIYGASLKSIDIC